MITRRGFFRFLGRLALTGAAIGVYGTIIEPGFLLRVQHYRLRPPRWTGGLKLRLVLLADPHLIEPHMPLSRWRRIVAKANALEGDVILLMGDYIARHRFNTGFVAVEDAALAAAALQAPLGVFAILGNHDWWEDEEAQQKGHGPIRTERAMAAAGIPVLVNQAKRLAKYGLPFWLTATDSIVAIKRPEGGFDSRADLPGTLAQVTDDAPIVHLAHEPDLFTEIPERVSLTLSGHTHGGQIRLFGWSPVTPSEFGNRFAYGHVVEDGRHLIVSGGLGCSIMPVRIGVPPEITVVDLG